LRLELELVEAVVEEPVVVFVSPEAERGGSSTHFTLLVGKRYVVFTQAEEAADRQDHLVRLA
jgi:hypothetical protein